MFKKLMAACAVAATLAMSGVALAAPADVMVPAGPGGGYDGTARLTMEGLQKTGIFADGANITNKTGGGGMVGLAEFFAKNQGNDNGLFSMGVIMVGAVHTTGSPITLQQLTPIARMTREFDTIAVSADSPIKTPQDFVAALKADPSAFAVSGGSAGGIDQIILGLIAKDQGIPLDKLNYIPAASGAETATMLGGGKISGAISGISEFKPLADAGKIRLIAVTSDERIPGLDVPTLKESGINVVASNWRGLMGSPGMTPEGAKVWVDRLTKLTATPEWAELLKSKGLEGAYLGGDEFATFLAEEDARIVPVLKDLGLVKQ
ncbi:MAG TPA: tripartite tricarboxylate transporter substrate binding protein [Mesorhizobium sp.]|jgi:putative tricarboxylic transport membrane protein